jgi:hypothetical protein
LLHRGVDAVPDDVEETVLTAGAVDLACDATPIAALDERTNVDDRER